jgi:hypothetical protein
MHVAAGGLSDQTIVQDNKTNKWDTSNPKIFNSHYFQQFTGLAVPKPPIDAATYARYGYPFPAYTKNLQR